MAEFVANGKLLSSLDKSAAASELKQVVKCGSLVGDDLRTKSTQPRTQGGRVYPD